MDGTAIPTVDRAEMHARGLRCIYQERQVRPGSLGRRERHARRPAPAARPGRLADDAGRSPAIACSRLGIELDLDRRVRGLSVAQLQLIEIARALTDDARLVVMDEPTAALHRSEVQRLFEVVRALRDNGVAVLYISHHLDEIFELADRVTVLRDGEVVDTVAVAGPRAPSDLVEMMFGRRVEEAHVGSCPGRRGRWRWSCAAWSFPVASPASTSTCAPARCSSPRAVSAAAPRPWPRSSPEPPAPPRAPSSWSASAMSPTAAARRTTSRSLPSDRKRRGLLLDEPVATNITLGSLARRGAPGHRSPPARRELAVRLAEAARVKAAGVDVRARTLSGGNQQKVMIGRWLDHPRKVVVIDEPTAGIDIASKFEIYDQLRQLAADGAAVLVCTTDFQEVGQVADRVVVLRDGAIVSEVAGAEASEHHLIELEAAA